ncbi:class I SAM-dependent methyltransferase [Haloarchaeobius iranensis]|uniref:Methyltransferase domain-containing protein n=1 Tax=Haloarchaeobius iranensis TaxID=996166 RepID=A0A1G9TTK5_9EURY|nr:class I SAM-dependent methyltransferase [Haloarchaeobius iranensis]SDM51083.1 Methyltransferase domain-containing protein [Haloarchaeobius iranensis]
MHPDAVREAYDAVGEAYGEFRRTDGPETALFDDLLDGLAVRGPILDAGCGDGRRTAAHIVDSRPVVGLDISAAQLRLAGDHVPAVDRVQGDMTTLPLADDSVAGVVAYYAVFHVDRQRHGEVYREFARATKPGGRLLANVSQRPMDGTRSDWLRDGVDMYWSAPGRAKTLSLLDDAGFEVVWERTVRDGLGEQVTFVLCERR